MVYFNIRQIKRLLNREMLIVSLRCFLFLVSSPGVFYLGLGLYFVLVSSVIVFWNDSFLYIVYAY